MLEKTSYKKALKKELDVLLTLYHRGEFALILEREKQLTSIYSNCIEALNIFGSANLALKKYKKAIINFIKALKINPFDQPAVELIKKETKKILIQ